VFCWGGWFGGGCTVVGFFCFVFVLCLGVGGGLLGVGGFFGLVLVFFLFFVWCDSHKVMLTLGYLFISERF